MSVRGTMPLAAAILALSCGARGTGEYRAIEETRLVDAGTEDAPAIGESSQLGDAIARWDTSKSSPGGPFIDEAACAGPDSVRAVTGSEMEQIFAEAFQGLLGSARFLATRVAKGLWEGGVLKANVAEIEGDGGDEGARKIWLGEGKVERRLLYVDAGRTRPLILRSSVANPVLVASGPSAAQRDVVILEVGARFAAKGGEVLALVDGTARLAAVLAQEGGAWRFVRFVDLKGIDESRAALCKAIAAPISQ
jgi:hypothetical protein